MDTKKRSGMSFCYIIGMQNIKKTKNCIFTDPKNETKKQKIKHN